MTRRDQVEGRRGVRYAWLTLEQVRIISTGTKTNSRSWAHTVFYNVHAQRLWKIGNFSARLAERKKNKHESRARHPAPSEKDSYEPPPPPKRGRGMLCTTLNSCSLTVKLALSTLIFTNKGHTLRKISHNRIH